MSGLSYAHIHTSVDLTKAVELAQALVDSIQGNYNATASPMNAVRRLQVQQAGSALRRLQTLRSMTSLPGSWSDQPPPPARSRRSPDAKDTEWIDSGLVTAARRLPTTNKLSLIGGHELSAHEIFVVCSGLRSSIALRATAADNVPFPTLSQAVLNEYNTAGALREPSPELVEQAEWYNMGEVTDFLSDQARLISYILKRLALQSSLNAQPTRTEMLLMAMCPQDISHSFPDLFPPRQVSVNPLWQPHLQPPQLPGRLTLADLDSVERQLHIPRRLRRAAPSRAPRSPLVVVGIAAAAVTSVGASTFGIINHIRLNQMQQQLDMQASQIGTIIVQVDELGLMISKHGEAINGLQRMAVSQFAATQQLQSELHRSELIGTWVSAITAMVDDITNIYHGALQHRLHVHAIPVDRLRSTLTNASLQAESLGFHLFPVTVSDVLQCELSFLPTRTGLSLFIHLPMFVQTLEVFEHLPLHVQVAPDVFLHFKPNQNIIAINSDATLFKVSSLGELAHCSKTGDMFWCGDSNILRRSANLDPTDQSGCLYHLLRSDFSRINSSCSIHLSSMTESAVELDRNKIVLSTTKPHSGMILCKDGRSSQFRVDPLAQVSVPDGCRLETSFWSVSAATDLTVETEAFSFGWNGDLKELLGDLDVEAYRRLSALHPLEPVPTEARSAAAWTRMKLERELYSFLPSSLSSKANWGVALAAIAIIVLIVMGVAWWHHRRHRTLPPLQPSSAPHAIQAVRYAKAADGVQFLQLA